MASYGSVKHYHWIIRDPVIVETLATHTRVQLHAAGHEGPDETEAQPHYHIYFTLHDGFQLNKLYKYLRGVRGCTDLTGVYNESGQLVSTIPCWKRESKRACDACGFYIKTTKSITSPLHEAYAFMYIARKPGSIYDPREKSTVESKLMDALHQAATENYLEQSDYGSEYSDD